MKFNGTFNILHVEHCMNECKHWVSNIIEFLFQSMQQSTEQPDVMSIVMLYKGENMKTRFLLWQDLASSVTMAWAVEELKRGRDDLNTDSHPDTTRCLRETTPMLSHIKTKFYSQIHIKLNFLTASAGIKLELSYAPRALR